MKELSFPGDNLHEDGRHEHQTFNTTMKDFELLLFKLFDRFGFDLMEFIIKTNCKRINDMLEDLDKMNRKLENDLLFEFNMVQTEKVDAITELKLYSRKLNFKIMFEGALTKNYANQQGGLQLDLTMASFRVSKFRKALLFAWAAFSKPTPESCQQLLILLLICLIIALIAGILMFQWLFCSLEYPLQTSAALAAVLTATSFALLSLIHPVRCMFTIMVPTLLTGQGRRLLISTCFMSVSFHIIPNIIDNVNAILEMLKCISQTSTESFINSTSMMEKAAHELGEEVTNVIKESAKLRLSTDYGSLDFKANINLSNVREEMLIVNQKIQSDFYSVVTASNDCMAIANKVLAGFFFFTLLGHSVLYMKCYLTDLKFDNIYFTRRLEQLAIQNMSEETLASSMKTLIRSTGLKMSRQEIFRCLMHTLILSFYMLLLIAVVLLDYTVFYFARTNLEWITNITTVAVIVNVMYKVGSCAEITVVKCITTPISSFNRDYPWDFIFLSDDCRMDNTKPPNISVIVAVGLICFCAYFTIFLETYANRMRRKIASSFFEDQEEQRVYYLQQRLLLKYSSENQTPMPIAAIS
ncbi:osteoclast stimulatory transmembrane protein [Protopterus annectens]|uniref:osteoclast stimulatory transmembrane protein n=1 Tax=Protopterus annectens TaxID=7888 RepID=UPI001CFC0689|nr:osteoclast stimulatory transmembrane protein [Protopterus annectens]